MQDHTQGEAIPRRVALHLVMMLCFLAVLSSPVVILALGSKSVVTTVAGTTSGFSGDGGPATDAQLDAPTSVALDGAGNIYIADTYNNRIRMVISPTAIITTVVGDGTYGFSGDGGLATAAQLAHPIDVALDNAGNLYIADYGNDRIRRVMAATGIITTVAGNGTFGFSGDGGPASAAQLAAPYGVALDGLGNLFIADGANDRIRKVISPTGIITTVAGGGYGSLGDGGPATVAELCVPVDVTLDEAGNLYIADNCHDRIRKVIAATGIITTLAGIGVSGFAGDGGLAIDAQLNSPSGVALDKGGNLFIADEANHRIREVIAATGIITTVAGTGVDGFSGDGGLAIDAELSNPTGGVVDVAGNLYFADLGNHRIREIKDPLHKLYLPIVLRD
jgi:sugar lactone lactonase YvrE